MLLPLALTWRMRNSLHRAWLEGLVSDAPLAIPNQLNKVYTNLLKELQQLLSLHWVRGEGVAQNILDRLPPTNLQ